MRGLRRLIWRMAPERLHEWWWYRSLRLPAKRSREEVNREYEEIVAAHGRFRGVFVFPMAWEWDTCLFQRPHQMARALARLGYLVFFWEANHRTCRPHLTRVDHGVYTCGAFTVPDVDGKIVVYAWTPEMRRQIGYIPGPFDLVYDIIDDPALMCSDRRKRSDHRWMLRHADLVTATADRLLEQARQTRRDALLCPNGADCSHFARGAGSAVPEDVAPLMDKPIVGYHGAVAEWLDYDLLREVVRMCPEMNFVFIGPVVGRTGEARAEVETSLAELKAYRNFHHLGPKPHDALPSYSSRYSAGMVPFQINEITLAVSPVKLFEYFASGAPAVSTPLPECAKYRGCLIANDAEEFRSCLRRLISGAVDVSSIKAEARENDWARRAEAVIAALGGVPTS